MRWRCSACEHENLGRHKQCQHCGKPKDREVFYDAPGEVSRADAITDAALLEQATAGADWECAYCGSHQRKDSGACVQCGAQQATSIDSSQRSAENSSAQSLPDAASSDAGGMVADSGARITKLDLSSCKSLKNVDGLAKLKHLVELDLSYCESLKSVEGLRGLKRLKKLDLYGCKALESVDCLANLPNLTSLNLGKNDALKEVPAKLRGLD